ncbi:hypothetical protein M1D55_19235 [Cupriavidus sp. JZ107]
MKAFVFCLLLAGCATPINPAVPEASTPAARASCPPLPKLQRGAGRQALLAHIDMTAKMYAECATRER